MWRPSYTYLNDRVFLKEIDNLRVKEQHIKITALSWFEENPLQEIQGYTTGGSINVSGKSSVRRTGSLSLEADDKIYNIKDVNNIISINKKIAIEVGFTNTTSHYNEYNIIWIPLGVYIIKTASVDHGTNGLKISLSISDKMCLLNGDVGGIFPATANLSEVVILNEYGEKVGTDYLILKDILKNVLYEYGGIQLGQIIIEDLEEISKAQVKWNGDDPLYHYVGEGGQHFYTQEKPDKNIYDTYNKGDLIGFRPQYFTWPGAEPLKANAGENVAAIIDKITKALGIFEFFFDVYGFFHFRQKATYRNQQEFFGNTAASGNIGYIPEKNNSICSYEFNDAELVTAFKNSPQYMNIKNDFVVWGQKNVAGGKLPIRYHLAIDKKPSVSNNKYLFEYTGETLLKDLTTVQTSKYLMKEYLCSKSLQFNHTYLIIIKGGPVDITADFDYFGVWLNGGGDFSLGLAKKVTDNVYTLVATIPESWKDNPNFSEDRLKGINVYNGNNWQATGLPEVKIDGVELILFKNFKQLLNKKIKFGESNKPYIEDGLYYGSITAPQIYDKEKNDYVTITNPKFAYFQPTDWRGELFAQSQLLGESYYSNPYAAELAIEFPKIYNLFNNRIDLENGYPIFKGSYFSVKDIDYDYFLDLIDIQDEKMQNISVSNIGRRTRVLNESSVNCIFAPKAPDIAFIEVDTETTNKFGQWAKKNGYDIYQTAPEIFEQISVSSAFNSAYDKVVDLLYTHSGYAETMSITTLPIYYLEPNTRIKVTDAESGIQGEYIAESFSLPLASNGTMTISCTKPIEKM